MVEPERVAKLMHQCTYAFVLILKRINIDTLPLFVRDIAPIIDVALGHGVPLFGDVGIDI